jgi:hypothetical protein
MLPVWRFLFFDSKVSSMKSNPPLWLASTIRVLVGCYSQKTWLVRGKALRTSCDCASCGGRTRPLSNHGARIETNRSQYDAAVEILAS